MYNETCQGTVPEAIISYLESKSFEEAIRNAISLGGDADTLAAIAGSIAEADYGIWQWHRLDGWRRMFERAFSYLDDNLASVINAWLERGLPTGVRWVNSDAWDMAWDSEGVQQI